MRSKISIFTPAIIASLVLSGCGSDGDESSGTDQDTITDAASTNDSFFNDDSRTSFATDVGGGLSRILSSALSTTTEATDSTATGIASRMLRATETGSSECPTSGSADFTVVTDDVTNELQSVSISYNDCNDGGEISTGSLSLSTDGGTDENNASFDISFSQFTVASEGEVAEINGDLAISASEIGDSSAITLQGNSLALSTTSSAETFAVMFSEFQVTTSFDNATGASSLAAQADIGTADGSVLLSISPALESIGDEEYPTTGIINMNASDGSALQIDADTGDVSTYNYVVTDAGGAVTSGTENWADTGIETDIDLESIL